MLPLRDLVNHPLTLVGLGSYDEDMDFLVMQDESEFSWHVPFVIGTCTLGRIVNVIKESEMDRLSTPWAMVRASHLLSQRAL